MHEVLGLAHFVATIVEFGVPAAWPAFLADLAQPLGLDRESEQPLPKRDNRLRQAPVGEIVGCQWKVRCTDAELQREIERRGRLAAARDADEDHLRLVEIARRR